MSSLSEQIKTEVKELEPCLQEVKYTVSAETLTKEINSIVNEFKAHAELSGFRKGKAPASIIKKKFADKIQEEIVNRCMSSAFDKSSKEDKLDVVHYSFEEGFEPKIEDGKDFSFTITYDVAPAIEVPEYKAIELTKPVAEDAANGVEERIAQFREMYAQYKTVEGKAVAGDMLKVSYTSDFEVADDASDSLKKQVNSDSNWVWLSEPETIPGAIEALTGAEAGKEYTIAAVYGDSATEEALKGKTVNYDITVVEVQRRSPVEDDAELCEMLSIDNMDALKDMISANLETELEQKNLGELRKQALDKVCGSLEFPLPPTLLKMEVEKQERQAAATPEGEEKEDAKSSAASKLKRFFVSRQIAEVENITVEQHEIDQQISMLGRYYGMAPEQIKEIMYNSGAVTDIHMEILVGKVASFIVENAKVS